MKPNPQTRHHRPWLAMACALAIFPLPSASPAAPGPASDDLAQHFVHPPDSARPWVYWFWLNGNITSNGITADLEAMKRVGIGGVLIMEVDQGAPVGPIGFMSAQWRERFKHVAVEAQRLGLEVNLNNDAGWNGSGGPWIKPDESMQKIVWSETNVAGPARFEGTLRQPPTVAGYYRDITVEAFPASGPYRIPDIQAKAAFTVAHVGPPAQSNVPPDMIINRGGITNLASRMDDSGRLEWDVPPGQWTIIRFGHTSTGVENAPAPATGRGLECDKLSREGVEANFNGMMAKLIADLGPLAGRALVATHVDSWENGSQNWTARMPSEFQRRRGYDLLPFLPVVAGRVVGSLEISERFLWDLRRTISDLVIENYARHLRELAHAKGLRFTIEAYGSPCDFLPYGGEADEPMGEFWMGAGAIETCKGMASAAHVYGKPIVGAEAFTAGDQERWREHPASIKSLGDRAFCEGINRFVFHRYALQPWPDRRPGMTMGPWGLHYERTQTWWEQTSAWHEYLARCQFLLRQGRFVADLCYLQPESPPMGFHDHPRQGYAWDECPADVLLSRMSVQDGRLALPDGMSYRLLVLPETRVMTPRLLGRIKALLESGATVVGPPPQRSPSLTGYPDCDRDVRRLAAEIWGDCDGVRVKERRVGLGRVVRGFSPEEWLARTGVAPDFSSRERLHYLHRAAGGTDLYFVANPRASAVTATAAFRISGRVPELWWPDTGRVERAAVCQETNGVTRVLLPLEPSGSVFVVFRRPAPDGASVVTVSRDGKTLFSAMPETAPKVVIERAVYGVLEDPPRTRDVRDKVQRKVDGGESSFRVADLAAGDDPAYNVVKTLVVDYRIGEAHFTARGRDTDTIRLTGGAGNLRIEKAIYGVLDDPKRTRDVRAKVQRLLDNGESSFQVARLAAGDDPAFGIVKTLVIEGTRNGEPFTATGTDPDVIDLAQRSRSESIVDLAWNGESRLTLSAWEPGNFELAMASGRTRTVSVKSIPPPRELPGPWEVRFTPGWGAPARATFDRLISWSRHPEPGIKYFSGTASYHTRLTVPSNLRGPNRRVVLDLGRVEVMATVKLNDRDLGLLWKPPYRVDVTDALQDGDNTLEVAVINLWPNRMVGDEQLPEDSDRNANGTLKSWPAWLLEGQPSPTGRYTFTSWRLWRKQDALLESGLIGPVTLRAVETVPVDLR